jgi:Flp pilus assembly protein TadD
MTENTDPIFPVAAGTSNDGIYRKAFLALAAFLLFLIPILSFDSGITDDDCIENEHGVRMMNYYLGRDTAAISSPIDEHGEWILKTRPDDYAANKNIYGGFFDMTCAFLYKYATSHVMGEYESKHFFVALSGALLFILIGLIAFRLTASWAVALLALLFACLSPRLVGHSFNDPKDIPFATAFAFGLYQIILLLQSGLKLSWSRAILLVAAIVISIDIRVGGIMLIMYLLFSAGVYILYQVAVTKEALSRYLLPFGLLVLISVSGYLGASLFWPWASKNPIMNPLICLRIFSQFTQFNSMELFEGIRVNNDAIPWYFVIKWFYISFPLFIVSGFFLFFVMWRWHIRDRFEQVFATAFIVLTVLLPLLLVIVQKSNVYDDARHLYFLLPSIVALCAIGWYWFFELLPRTYIWPGIIVCLLTMLEPMLFMVRNHPHEAMYFSPAIGGVKGAFKKYEMDYWGFSIKAAVNWIDKTDSVLAKGRKTKVRLWYGEQNKIKYYTDKSKNLEYILAPTASPEWDYWIMLPAESKHMPGLLENWPPPNTAHQIMTDDVPLCAIVRNPLSTVSEGHKATPMFASDDHMSKGLAYYNAKDYNRAILEFKLFMTTDSNNVTALNNIVAAYNLLGMYKDAIEVGSKALKIKPDFDLLKNNLAVSQEGLKGLNTDEKFYIAASYNYFVQGEYQKCIYAAEMILQTNPKSAAAYNNICSANNALGRYTAAKQACEKAQALAPGDQLVKNNLTIAVNGINAQKK